MIQDDSVLDDGTEREVTHTVNPLVQAEVIERLQFDGDIPEWRTCALPYGATLAISVESSAVSLVAIGEAIARSNATDGGALATSGGFPIVVRQQSDHPIVGIDNNRAKELAWTVVSTTHGRRSMVWSIRSKMVEILQQQYGLTVSLSAKRPPSYDRTAWSSVSFDFPQGKNSMNHHFDMVTVAAVALARGLINTSPTGRVLYVEDRTVIKDRKIVLSAVLVHE